MDKGTIGSSPAEMALNQLFMQITDLKEQKRIVHTVMRRNQRLVTSLKRIRPLRDIDVNFYKKIARLLWQDESKSLASVQANLPLPIYSHAQCVMKTLYRKAIHAKAKR